jgi:hypothetical protein
MAKLSGYLVLAAMLLAGCGPFGGEDRSKLSTGEKQQVSLNIQDLEDFCGDQKLGVVRTDILLDGVDGLIGVYRDNEPDAIYDFEPPKRPMRSVLRTEEGKLEKCGKDGRAGAAKLERTLQED